MGDYGIKIAKEGKEITSNNPDDYIFISNKQSLPLIQKVTVYKEIGEYDCEGSFLYEHNLGDYFFTLVYMTDLSYGNKQILPFSTSEILSKTCDSNTFKEEFSYKIHKDNIEIFYNVKCIIPMYGETCPLDGFPFGGPFNYQFDIYIYMLEIGA
jgi:hypothetical protein